jgi:hypothetical protein
MLGGACWVVAAFLDGSVADALTWVGLGVLTAAAFAAGTLIAGGSLVLLRIVVGIGCAMFGWSLVAVAVHELPRALVCGVVGGAALLLGLGLLATRPRSTRPAGAHSR